ncbi:Transcription initiation factor IIB 7 protein, partial [Halorhabdus tiamatea SARL4B]
MSETNTRTRLDQSTTVNEDETETEAEDVNCPECGGNLISDTERGETVCTECGLVVEEDEIDPGPEWRAFDAKEKDQKSRVGA